MTHSTATHIRVRIQEAEEIAALLESMPAAQCVARARAAGLAVALAALIPGAAAEAPLRLPVAQAEPAPAVPAEAPTAAQAPRKRRKGPKPGQPTPMYSPERLQLMRELWPTDTATAEIFERLNALPGPPIGSIGSLGAKAKTMPDLPKRPHWTLRLTAEERDGISQRLGEKARAISAARAAARRTPERDQLIREMWPNLAFTTSQIAERCRALPGAEVGDTWVWHRALELGLPSSRKTAADEADAAQSAAEQLPAPAPAAPVAQAVSAPAPSPARAGQTIMDADWRRDPLGTLDDEERADAEEIIFKLGRGARALAEDFDWPLERAQAVATALRATRQAAA